MIKWNWWCNKIWKFQSVSSGIPRSAPINMKQSNRRSSNCNCDINSISPPSVQFAIGTPPSSSLGNRRRSTSGGGPETPPIPPCTWQISPSATTNFQTSPSALRRSGTAPDPSSALAKLSSPTLLTENNNNPLIGTRAFTLPDMGVAGANGFSLLHNDSKNALDDHPITFYAPELPAETLLDVSCKFPHFTIQFTVFLFSGNITRLSLNSTSSSPSPIAFWKLPTWDVRRFQLWCPQMSHRLCRISRNRTRQSTAKERNGLFCWFGHCNCCRVDLIWRHSSCKRETWNLQTRSRTVSENEKAKSSENLKIRLQFCRRWTRNTEQRWANRRNSTQVVFCNEPQQVTSQPTRFSTITQFKW